MIPKETIDKYWEVNEAYREKFGEYFPDYHIQASMAEAIIMMEEALRTGEIVVADLPEGVIT